MKNTILTKRVLYGIWLLFLLLAACRNQEEDVNLPSGKEVTVRIPFGFTSAELAASTPETLREDATEDALAFCLHATVPGKTARTRAFTRFVNTWVLVFSSDGTCKTCINTGDATPGTPVEARIPTETDMTLYLLCNGPATLPRPADLQTFESNAYFSDAVYTDENTVPYIGKLRGLAVDAEGNLADGSGNAISAVTVERLVAKISLTCRVAVADYRIASVQLHNAASKIYYAYSQANAEVSALPLDACIVSGDTYTWFTGENLRGNGSSTTQTERYAGNAPASSSFIRITLQSTIGAETVAYTIYPGNNLTDNYDVARNRDYTYTTSLTKTGAELSADQRVTAANVPADLTSVPSNCYILAPGQSYKFDPRIKGEGQNETGGVTIPLTHSVTQMKLIWQDTQSLVQSIGLSGDGSYSVVVLTTGVEGNAVVAACSGERVVWCWHLWVRKNRLDKYTSNQIFLACNLGALNWANTDTKKYGINSLGLIYQWGRPVPFPGASAVTGGKARPVYDLGNNLVNLTALQGAQTVSDAIASPTAFIYTGTEASWHTDGDDLWGGQLHVKTIFDPCPRGWKLPSGDDAWNDWTTDAASNKAFAWSSDPPSRTLKDRALFPACGFYTDAPAGQPELINAGTTGMYWNDTPDGNAARVISFDASTINRTSVNQTYGCSIRPVQQ